MRTSWQQSVIGLVLFAGLGMGTALATTQTIATFADPALDGSTPLFTVTDTELSGGWSGTHLRLRTPISGQEFENVTFTMTPVSRTNGTLGAGTIEFFRSAADGGALILRIQFTSGLLFDQGFSASSLAGNGVTFSGPIIAATMESEQFSFSFANTVVNGTTRSHTATFSSSGTVTSTGGGGDNGGGTGGGGTGGGDTGGGGTGGGDTGGGTGGGDTGGGDTGGGTTNPGGSGGDQSSDNNNNNGSGGGAGPGDDQGLGQGDELPLEEFRPLCGLPCTVSMLPLMALGIAAMRFRPRHRR